MSIENLIQQKLIQIAKEYFEKYLEQKTTKKWEESFRRYVKKITLPDNSFYSNFSIRNHQLEKLVVASTSTDLGVEFIVVNFLFYAKKPNLSILKEDLQAIRQHFPKVKNIKITLDSSNASLISLLTKLNFTHDCVEYIGNVQKGLESLCDLSLPQGITIRPMNYRREIEQVMKIEKAAHQLDGTSVIKKYSKKRELEMRDHYKKMCKIGSCFVALYHGDIVGSIGTYPNKTLALLATIAVTPKYWNRGIGQALYQRALEDLKERKNRHYKGYTSTQKVLAIGEKLGRRVSYTILKSGE